MGSKVSVVIPMYNSRDTIVPCVQSVIDQTYKGLITIVVVNDGSKDDSLAVLETAFKELPDNRVLTILNKENGGVSSARNMGINAAQTEWVAFLDSDDIWFPEKLEKQLKIISENSSIFFIGCNRNGEVYPFFGKKDKELFSLSAKEILIKWYPQTSTVIVKRDFLIRVGLYNELQSHGEDCNLWLRLLKITPLWLLNQDLVLTGGGKRSFGISGLSANMVKMYKGEIYNLKAAFAFEQVNLFEFMIFRVYFWVKYLRRLFIVWVDR
ncbi:glycosyltransferase family 2 protein [Ectopseudomonas oleovorans]|uniref:glycosyltransferase family 2 protein n=1 Tax=Ectopseudomonas oleovorans TaxID=301 RepID=UPI00241C1A35|nr:glycosyltransferase family 2 protein [Pseudomonas oleovorans]